MLNGGWIHRLYSAARSQPSEELVATAKRFAVLSAAMQDYAIFQLDPLGAVVSWDAGAERLKGYRADDIIGENYARFYRPEDVDRGIPQQHLATAAATGRCEVEHWRVRKDGSQFWAVVTITALHGATGGLTGFYEVSRHTTPREETAATYRGLLEAAPDAMVVVDERQTIVLLNLQAERQFGYSRNELVGQNVVNIIPDGFAERLVADGTRSPAEALAQQIDTGLELTGRRKDGTTFPIEIMLSPLESAAGVRVTAAIRNISVRRRAEQHLVQMESRYRGLLEAAPDAMVVVDEGETIVLLNVQAERRFGYRRDELLGQQVQRIIPEGFTERLLADGKRSSEGGLAQQMGTGLELTGRRKDGSAFPIEIMLSPLDSPEGTLVTAAIRDITDRKRAEDHLRTTVAALERSNDELAQFAQVASHDLQEPLRMVASYTQLLAKRYKGRLDADADEFIAYAVDGSNRMQALIQDLLAYSRAGVDERPLRATASQDSLAQAVDNLKGTIQQSGAVVTHGPLPAVTTDHTLLAQVFQNLVGNAIKYRGDDVPRVHVSATNPDGYEWHFAVVDNGIGIEPRYFERIFVIFQRLHGREEFEGTGIGLAICKKAITRLGGRIWVTSQVAKGSTFHFTLPGDRVR